MILTTVIGGRMAQTKQTPKRKYTKRQPTAMLPQLDVPVQRLAEFVPASFTATDEREANPLNMSDARWYKTGDDALTLVLDNGQAQIALEFKATALCALAQKSVDMSACDVDDLLDLS